MKGDSGKEGVWGEGWEDGGLGNGPLGGDSKRKIPLVKEDSGGGDATRKRIWERVLEGGGFQGVGL